MNSIFYVAVILATIVALKNIFKLDFKEAKKLDDNKELEKLTDRFPDNIQIAQEMLEMLNNKNVKIEEMKNTSTSLYIAVTNKIQIADMKNNYARIQTIAHECIHSVQDRRWLIFNFIFSNFIMLYWIIITILTITNKIQNIEPQMFIMLLFITIKIVVRGYLETDAMTKSTFLAEKYIKQKNILKEEQIENLLTEYKKINKIGIPYTIVHILTSSLLWLLLYAILNIIITNIKI